MIPLTRLNRDPFFLNALLIEQIEATPDTVITLTNGVKLTVAESPDHVIDLIEQRRNRAGAAVLERQVG